jgi:hypothetical protein
MALSESSQPNHRNPRPVYEWVVAATLVVTSAAAVAALFFTSQSIKATNSQLRISEQGQITDRYNAAIANLGPGLSISGLVASTRSSA